MLIFVDKSHPLLEGLFDKENQSTRAFKMVGDRKIQCALNQAVNDFIHFVPGCHIAAEVEYEAAKKREIVIFDVEGSESVRKCFAEKTKQGGVFTWYYISLKQLQDIQAITEFTDIGPSTPLLGNKEDQKQSINCCRPF